MLTYDTSLLGWEPLHHDYNSIYPLSTHFSTLSTPAMEAFTNDGSDDPTTGGRPRVELGAPESSILTQDELERALELKSAAEKETSLENLSDFEYVQYAIAHPTAEGTSVETLLQHMHAMQCFRQEYKITDTAQEGLDLYQESTLQHPGLFLAVEYLSDSGNFITIDDWAGFFPAQIRSNKNRRILMASLYYRYQVVCATFLAIRQGIAAMAECEGCGFHNLDANFHEAVMYELFQCYPKRHKEILFLNSPTVINVAHSLWKKYMTQDMKNAFRLGYQIQGMEGRRIDELFKMPTPEAARQTMLSNVKSFLELRYDNQKNFVLPATADDVVRQQQQEQPQPMMVDDER